MSKPGQPVRGMGVGPPAARTIGREFAVTTTHAIAPVCSPAGRITRSLLGYGVLAGPFYVAVSLAQALTRDGFDLTRDEWSLLSNGRLGWIQVTNFVLTGLMVLAASVGIHRALASGIGAGLLGGYGLSLIAAGLLRADPAHGFPVGAPSTASLSGSGLGHLIAGAIGFGCLIAACFVLARRFTGGWAIASRVTGVVFLAGFVGIASGAGSVAVTLAFTAAVVIIWAWLAAICLHLYRTVA